MAKICVHIQLDRYPTNRDKEFCIDFTKMIENRLHKLDHPSLDYESKAFAFLCSSTKEINQQLSFRKETAQYLACELTNSIMEALGSYDTKMGYES